MKRVLLTLVALVSLQLPQPLNAQIRQPPQPGKPFWSDLRPGRFAVGFRVLYYRDQTRRWGKQPPGAAPGPGRPIRVSVWYPARTDSSGERMTYGDYLQHKGPREFEDFNEKLDENDRESWLSDLHELSPPEQPEFERLGALPVAARRDASPAYGHFPLLLYSGGKASRADANVELAEYLASHGYVVATVPQLGPSEEEMELGSSPRDLSLHSDDYEAALIPLHSLSDIDFSRFATAGHSSGGEVAVELALRHPEIRAVIGLDASYGTTFGVRVLRQLPEYKTDRKVGAELLDLRRANGSQGVKLDLSAIDALHWRHVYRIQFEKAFHGDFTEWGMTAIKLSIPMPANPDGHTRQLGYEVNTRTCEAVLEFLDAILKARTDALRKLTATTQSGT